MSTRERILVFLLWWSVIALSTWVGGTLYQMLVVVPLWSSAPPESVRAFFHGTAYNETIWNFFGPPFMAARILPVVAALGCAWHRPQHRAALLVAVIALAAMIVFTVAVIYPLNAVLFTEAGGTLSGPEIAAMAERWVTYDRLRFAVGCVAFAAVLVAFKLPLRRAGDSASH